MPLNNDFLLPEPLFEVRAEARPPFGVEVFGHQLDDRDFIAVDTPIPCVRPEAVGRRPREDREAAEAIGQNFSEARVNSDWSRTAPSLSRRESRISIIETRLCVPTPAGAFRSPQQPS